MTSHVVEIDIDTLEVVRGGPQQHRNDETTQAVASNSTDVHKSRSTHLMEAFDVTSVSKTAITWKDLSYFVRDKKDKATGIWSQKTILDHVNGVVYPGEVVAIMGPSGSGKTTLLDILANRVSSGEIQGSITINGRPRGSTFKHYAAYVQQEDTLYGTMSVRETFAFVAAITKAKGSTKEDENRRIDEVIQVLGLSICENVAIGNIFKKGISGGQKRRVSLGIELLKKPSIIFCDEPTSGLDSASAFKIVEHLKDLGSKGMAIVCTIHQPSSEIFHVFDKLMLLASGKTVYFGETDGSVDYFKRIGYVAPLYSNPADYFMQIVNTDFVDMTEIEKKKHRRGSVVQDTLADVYRKSELNEEVIRQVNALEASAKDQNIDRQPIPHDGFSTTIWDQFHELIKRRWVDNIRNPAVYWVRLAMFLVLSLMLGTMDLQIPRTANHDQDRISLLVFASAFLVFMSIAVVPAFIEDRAIFTRERANGYYHVAAHVISDALVCIPGLFFISVVCSAIIYWIVGLSHGGEGFIIFVVNLFLSLYCAEGMLQLIAACVPHYIIGMALGAGMYGMFMLCEGFFVIPSNIPDWWIWGYYIGFLTYSFEIFVNNEFHGWNPSMLQRFQMENAKIPLDFGVMIIMAFGYRVLYFLVMQFFRTGKR